MSRYGNMSDDPGYQALVEKLAHKCTCTPESDRPCDGLLAGGMCDDLHMDREITDEEDDTEPDDL
jgi:hypothetical protein